MKISTKLGIGLSVAAVAGIYATLNYSEEILEKLEREKTRYKTKKIVKNKFSGNETLLNLADNLSDDQLETIIHIAKKFNQAKEML